MFPASVRGPGINICAPDVCLTPPVPLPIPYVNVGQHAVAVSTSTVVMFGGMFAINTGSNLPVTQGDEAGTVGGVISGTVMSTGYFITGSPIVMIQGLPAVRVTSMATGNNSNAVGAVVSPGVPTVLVAWDIGSDVLDESRVQSLLADLHRDAAAHVALLPDDVGYIRIDRFRIDTARVFFNAQKQLLREGARTFLIDLRGCEGGDLESAYMLAADFLPEGAVLGRTIDADGDLHERVAMRDGPYRFALTVAIDEHTKSAAEVFAGALCHHRRARLAGSRTFGKASAQRLARDGHGSISLTTCVHLQLPDGSSYEGVGIPPSPWVSS